MTDDNPRETFSVTVARLNSYGLGYLHVVETAQDSKGSNEEALAMSAHLRALWKGLYVVNGGYDGLRERKHYGPGMPTLSPTAERFWPTQIYQGGCDSEPP